SGRLLLLLRHHASGGSSSKILIQIVVAIRFATIVVRAPTPASRPLHIRRLVRSLLIGAGDSTRDGGGVRGGGLEAAAYRLDYERFRPLELIVAGRQIAEDPAGEELLDRPVEAHRGEVGGD